MKFIGAKFRLMSPIIIRSVPLPSRKRGCAMNEAQGSGLVPAGSATRSPEQRFADFLQSRGMRHTDQRRSLLKIVFAQHDHFDADQLIERLPKKGEPGHVSRPTVYRTLTEFVEAGLLRKFELEGRAVYEHDYGYPEHDHLYCTQCQRLIEFQDARLSQIRKEVAARHRFQDRSHRLIIQGVCEACRMKRRRKPRPLDRI